MNDIPETDLVVIAEREVIEKRYLGDSVYAAFDGCHVWLTTENGYPDDPRNKIALEPQVIEALNRYVEYVKGFYNDESNRT